MYILTQNDCSLFQNCQREVKCNTTACCSTVSCSRTPIGFPITWQIPVPVTPAIPSSSHQLTPQQLNFGTPSEQSLALGNSSQLTPQIDSVKLGWG